MSKSSQSEVQRSFIESNPGDWPALSQPMTEAQRWHIRFLAAEAGEAVEENLSRSEAARKINTLRAKTKRGKDSQQG